MTAEPREVQEGDLCRDEQCMGSYEWTPPENCCCHISSPCEYCLEEPLTCDICGLTAEEAEDMN